MRLKHASLRLRKEILQDRIICLLPCQGLKGIHDVLQPFDVLGRVPGDPLSFVKTQLECSEDLSVHSSCFITMFK